MAWMTAINTKEGWKAHMGPKAHEAEEKLWALFRYSYSKCDICGTGAQGMETHIVGQTHWKKIGGKFDWKLPPPEVASDLSQQWVEKIETPTGPFFFNHVTGEHGFMSKAEGSAAQQAALPPATAPPTYHQQAPSAATPYPQAQPAMAEGGAVPSAGAGGVGDMAYHDALRKDKGAWRSFMEPRARAAEETLHRATGSWDFGCMVCEQDNTRGMTDHLPSEKHWKKLGDKLNWNPPNPVEAHDMNQKWVQRIQTGRGVFAFNHVTGAHCLEGSQHAAISSTSCPSAATSACTPPMANICAPCKPPVAKFSHAHWLWVKTVRIAAEQVDELTSHPDYDGGCPPTCVVCSSSSLTKEHLLSREHFDKLQERCAGLEEAITAEAVSNVAKERRPPSPWMQKLEAWGQAYYFNHITGKELWAPRHW
eukprot:TRINITY_DN29761_c0_g1_i1.p1 TRINITY_DN29761_c0_g1~~TRINITY_DN29761_c0_g1_i1.p1  ORF type:complete len:422 (+),score=67.52 TRINITY_DN29761_c0_g1_i1:44-1309(+)